MDSRAPQKPWERRIPGAMAAPVNYRSTDFAPSLPPSSTPGPPVLTRMAPPLPPRPVQQTYGPPHSTFNSSFHSSFPSSYGAPYGSSSFYTPGYSPYGYSSGYGIGGYGHGRILPHSDEIAPSRFVQQAEESSRGAFQSIESIVHAFGSVSMMLDATFSAVYNSFRAVLDVANHFTRLRAHLTRVLSAFALVRTLRYLYRRLQRILGRRMDSEADDLWAESATDALVTTGGAEEPSVKSWPIFLFFAVVLGGPYLIWKLLSSATDTERTDVEWASGQDDHVVARAEFDFTAASEEEISMRAGDMLNLAPKELQPRVRGWLLASLDGQTTGLVPANYVKVLGKRRGRRQAEMEAQQMNAPVQPATTAQPNIQTSSTLHSGLRTTQAQNGTSNLGQTEELLEQVYGEGPNSNIPTVINIEDKNEL